MNYELDVGVLMWLVSRASRIFPRMRMHPVFGSVEDGFELCRMYKPFILATSFYKRLASLLPWKWDNQYCTTMACLAPLSTDLLPSTMGHTMHQGSSVEPRTCNQVSSSGEHGVWNCTVPLIDHCLSQLLFDIILHISIFALTICSDYNNAKKKNKNVYTMP